MPADTIKSPGGQAGVVAERKSGILNSVTQNILPVRKIFKSPARQALFDYGQLLYCRYVDGGMDAEEAAKFAIGEVKAIETGNHWQAGYE